MLFKTFLIVALVSGALSLECAFEIKSNSANLNVNSGIDECESSDEYCVSLTIQDVYAKGCSMTAQKIVGLPTRCTEAACTDDKSICCCKGDKCNGSATTSAFFSLLALTFLGLFLKH